MTFQEQLNQYIDDIGCSAKVLADLSGLSTSTISRYRTGERVPPLDGEPFTRLCSALEELALKRKPEGYEPGQVYAELRAALLAGNIDYEQFADRFHTLLNLLDIRLSELAQMTNYDASYLSRVRTGQRHPSDLFAFSRRICGCIQTRDLGEETVQQLADLIGCPVKRLQNPETRQSALENWLTGSNPRTVQGIEGFLQKLDAFDLDEYIRAIHFDRVKVSTVPFQLPTTKTYYGIEAMKEGELDFLKATALSGSAEPVYLYSDMPMADMAADQEFAKKYMFGLAALLKKGLTLHIIHNVERPFKEMMLGLEGHIPLYMTGQIMPYYLKGTHNSVFCHFHKSSGAAALSGECIADHHGEGRYILSKSRQEIDYFRNRAKYLFEKAYPLMHIYRENSRTQLEALWQGALQKDGNRHNILSSLPIYTIPDALLEAILEREKIPGRERVLIREYVVRQKKHFETVVSKNPVLDEIPLLYEDEYTKYPLSLSLSGMFYERSLLLSFDEYKTYYEATRRAARTYSLYQVQPTEAFAFRNIQIQILEGAYAVVSKNQAPAIHFVIHHPRLLSAIEHMTIPVRDA